MTLHKKAAQSEAAVAPASWNAALLEPPLRSLRTSTAS